MGVQLDERYQVEIYEAIKQATAQRNRAAIIMPPGTGKTVEALKLIEDNPDKSVTYLSPSPKINAYIRKQIRNIYGKEADKILSRITFKTYNGLMREYKTHPVDIRENGTDIIIEDEAHRAGAKEWGKAVEYLEQVNPNATRLAMTATLREFFVNEPSKFDPREYLGPARAAVKELVKHKMQVLGTAGNA